MESDGKHRIFVYGSLMFPEVWNAVVGRPANRSARVVAHGYSAFCVSGQDYPGLVSEADAAVTEGVLIFDLIEEDWQRLDAFEGSFYERVEIRVQLVGGENEETHRAQTYLVRDGFRSQLTDELWNAEAFAKTGLSEFIGRFVS